MKLKTKIIFIVSAVVLLIGGLALYGVLMYQKGWQDAQQDALPEPGQTASVEPIKDRPCTISIDDVRYYDLAVKFVMTSTGTGAGEGTIRRPEKWLPTPPPKNIIIVGLGGGYSCGHWLPGGSAAYLRRVGGFRGVNFYLGPELSIAALDRYPVVNYIDIKIYLQVAATW